MEDFNNIRRKIIDESISIILKEEYFSGIDTWIECIKSRFEWLGFEFSAADYQYIEGKLKARETPYKSEQLVSIQDKNLIWATKRDIINNRNRNYWNVYRANVEKFLHFTTEEADELEDSCLSIINKIAPPNCQYERQHANLYKQKGLVYGNVQSGKTASMGGVISQYVSFGCNIVIVLSGVHNNLRKQTSERLRRDLGIDDQGNNTLSWRLVTDASDLLQPNIQPLTSCLAGSNVVMGVFKKNSKVLERLNHNFLNISDDSAVTRNILEKCTALIIDDECDQASPDVSKEDDIERSKINREITNMLGFFPRYVYIGYTATPFANVLNEGPGINSLYPSTFITMLKEKQSYFGASKIFGVGEEFATYKEEEDQLMDITNVYDADRLLQDITDEELFWDPIIYFSAATAARIIRGRHNNDPSVEELHSTMMIHTSGKIGSHREVYNLITELLERIRRLSRGSSFKEEVHKVWNKYYLEKKTANLEAVADLFGADMAKYYVPSFEELYKKTVDVLRSISLKIDDSAASEDERLSYPVGKSAYIIAVGGNTLSRGITLEGLIVTVFTRKVSTYDTQLQMGRWFGYRHLYEDLVRLWLTKKIYINFQFLAGVELDLRNTIEKYDDETPLTMAVAIRTTPHMQIVRKNAMKSAVKSSINYIGKHPQTIYFENSKKWLQENIDACKNLISNNSSKRIHACNDGYLISDVSSESISEFLGKYNFYSNSNGLDRNLLLSFKEKAEANGIISGWNIVIKSPSSDNETRKVRDDILPGFKINMLERGKERVAGFDSRIYLQGIATDTDIICDIPDFRAEFRNYRNMKNSDLFKAREKHFGDKIPGLLIIYPINGDSKPKSPRRIPMDAENDVFGICIVFPDLNKHNRLDDLYERVSIPLPDNYSIEDI